ncbi:J domain-containing protein [Phytopseudomonas dryadis]|uniref:J domain-containing protein n=1 Tax=Phytopseudomonas dryadis TaxID=2487520 RepID=A0A4Q9QZW7_9GAMM|nr:J domain-containing protein [Pseudomonas dryadis]TBU91587.1 hypothetical protein DNK44_14030 [Pseudomonas dryadis]
MNPWKLLGLDAGADTRSIKRRYAQLLKQHRPDDDAEAFQRLREAYEQALRLAAAGSDEASAPACEPALASAGQPRPSAVADEGSPLALAPLAAVTRDADVQARIGQLLDAASSLDEALRRAREQGLEADFQRHLLARCAAFDERGVTMLRWAMRQLHWLSPWQADYLPQAHLDGLAGRLLALELEQLRRRLQAGEERAVLEAVGVLLASDWLHALDRRLQLQHGLIRLLEEVESWSAAFFERLGALLGWDEDQGELPCSRERWHALCRRCERQAAGLRLQQQLRETWPLSAEQRAAWLLLKPLDEGECRRLVDRFGEDDWLACEALDELLHARYPELPALLGLVVADDWRRWQPRNWAAPAAVYAWLLLFASMFADALYRSMSGVFAARSKGLLGLGLENLVASLFMIALLACLARGWGWLARFFTVLDMPLSRLLLPAAWRDRGAGMLLLRHGVPAALFAALIALFAPAALDSRAVFAGVLALQLLFLGLVGSGRSPWPRLAMLRGGLFKVDYSRKAEW